jgi:hypothetical protein
VRDPDQLKSFPSDLQELLKELHEMAFLVGVRFVVDQAKISQLDNSDREVQRPKLQSPRRSDRIESHVN